MAIQHLSSVSSSLNLGLIYKLSYRYTLKDGVRISLFFVNQNGLYTPPTLQPLVKQFISIGPSSFSLYPVRYTLSMASGRRIIEVEFVDELFMLDHYLAVWPGRGCGDAQHVFFLGTQVDNRTDAQKVAASLDTTAQQIKSFTQFPDYEHTLLDFITLLQRKFPVQVLAQYDPILATRNNFEGTFRQVLDSWCKYYNFSFFLENGTIKIFNPATITIPFPAQPTDAIEYIVEEDVRSTYGKTVFAWYQQDGGEYALSQASNNNGPAYVRTNTLFPVGSQFNLPQPAMDLNQVAAAQYGQEFWFLYNYSLGTTSSQCGWTPIPGATISATKNLSQTSQNIGLGAAVLDVNVYNQQFAAYQQYGQKIAGRWYLSDEMDDFDLAVDQSFKWFDESNGQITSFTDPNTKGIQISYLNPPNDAINTIPETIINQYYPGVNYVGNRTVYQDTFPMNLTGTFVLGDKQGLVTSLHQQLFVPGSDSIDFSELNGVTTGANKIVGYNTSFYLPSNLELMFNAIQGLTSIFNPRFSTWPIKGISNSDYVSLQSAQSEPNSVSIITNNQGPSIVGNTAVIKTIQNGAYTVYYNKYSNCAYYATPDLYYGYQFEPHQISTDNQIGITFSKTASNTYSINRDYSFINGLVNNPLLPLLAQARIFNTKRVTFSLNYLYSVPTDFLSNGLTAMELEVGDAGITASYTFSNEVLEVPNFENRFNQLEQKMRNTWIRTYRPKETIT